MKLNKFIDNQNSNEFIFKLKISPLYAFIGDSGVFGGYISVDYSESFYGMTLGFEIGGLKGIEYSESYNTLEGFQQQENYKEDIQFSNIRFFKQFNNFPYPYIGVTHGLSNGNFSQYPNVVLGVSIDGISNIPFYIDFEIRSVITSVEKENIEFNRFGDYLTNPRNEALFGVGFSIALFYLF